MSVDFVRVRKGRGRVHLSAALTPGRPIHTLCDRSFGAEEVSIVEEDCDCQACLRRQADPGRVSSALFDGGRGDALLQMSLQQARERRESGPRPAEIRPPSVPAEPERSRARLTIVPTEPPRRRPRPAPEGAPPTPAESLAKPAAPEATNLPRGLYRTPGGIVIRVGVHAERPRLERRADDRVRIVAGDLEIDVPPA